MATSSARLVPVVVPPLKFWVMPDTLTPSPTCEPANMSAKETLPDLKPAVAELAMLLPITSRLVAAAFKPLTA